MNKLDLAYYFWLLVRRFHLILAIALVTLLAATVGVRYLPTMYNASAKILVEAPQIPTDLARSTVSMSGTAQLQILQQQITTREALLTLAKKLDIYRGSKIMPSDEDIVQDLRSRIKFDEVQLDTQNPEQGIAVYVVSFRARTAALASDVANELARMILDRNQRERTDRAGNTLQFFDQKVARLGAELKRLEAETLEFTNAHKDTLPESLGFRRSQQSSLQEKLSALEREEAELRISRNQLIMSYTGTSQVPGAVPLTPEQQTLADLNKALADQLAVFTEDSPNIVALRARIANIRKNIIPQAPGIAKATEASREAAEERQSFGLELQLPVMDERLKAIARDKVDTARHIEELTRSIAATPATEATLTSLQRNRENIQTQYNASIAQRAEALTGDQIERGSDGQRFSLLESATPPSKPTGLKHKIIIAIGALAGLGLGLAIVLLLEILDNTVRRPKDIRKLLQMDPLGTVPVIKPPRDKGILRFRMGPAALLSASAIPASIVLVHYYFMPLDSVVQRLLSGLI